MGAAFLYSRLPQLQSAVVSFASAADNEIIAAVAGKRILVHRLYLVCAGATNLTFKRGTTALSGALPMSAGGGITFDISGEPWFTTGIAEAFNITSSGAFQVSGTVYFDTR